MNDTTAETTAFRLGYRRWLDGLRGAAILMVLAYHARLLRGGSLGVDIFFVLSGFLITSILLEERERTGTISLKQFYLRRMLRLLPAFAVLLLAVTIVALMQTPQELWPAIARQILVAACYLSNWHWFGTHGLLGHTWSLSVEEQFYLLWPALLCFLLPRLTRRQMVKVVIGGILASALLRFALHHQHRVFGSVRIDILRMYTGLDTRADALLAGCLAGMLTTWNLLPRTEQFSRFLSRASIFAVGVTGYCLFRRDMGSAQYYDGLFTLLALSIGVLILRLLRHPGGAATRLLESAPLVGAGRISYGLYLYHIPIYAFFDNQLGPKHPGNTALAIVSTLAAALLSFFLIERPFLRLKDRVTLSRARLAADPVVTGANVQNADPTSVRAA